MKTVLDSHSDDTLSEVSFKQQSVDNEPFADLYMESNMRSS